MAIKRLHYYDQQLLVESDFTDEQSYHIEMRRRMNRLLHGFGIVRGLDVLRTGSREVRVKAGEAVDRDGREIVLEADQLVTLNDPAGFPPNTAAYITIEYGEQQSDPRTSTVSGNARWTEAPMIKAVITAPPTDGSVIILAMFTLTASGDVPGGTGAPLDGGVRQMVTSALAPGAVTESNIAADAVTDAKIARGAVSEPKLAPALAAKINDARTDINNLASQKVSRSGDRFNGPLTVDGHLNIGTAALENAEGWQKVIDVFAPSSVKLSLRTGGIDGRVLTHETGWWGARPGVVIGTRTPHAVSLATQAQARLTVDSAGRVGIGTTTPAEPLEVVGRVKCGPLSVGPWPSNLQYAFVGANTLDQTAPGNYALLQGADGRTYLNSPVDIRFRIGNIDQMTLANNGTLGIGTGTPNSQLHISGGKWDVTNSEGDLKIGNDATRLKIGIALGGGGAGDVRIRSHGGTGRLFLGSNTTDAMYVQDSNVTLQNYLLSSMFRVTQLLADRAGPLAASVVFSSGGGTLVLFACGSGWSPGGAGHIGMYVQVDGSVRASAATFTNEPGSHRTFVANAAVVRGVPAGNHTLTLAPWPGTVTDSSDHFNVTVLELPF